MKRKELFLLLLVLFLFVGVSLYGNNYLEGMGAIESVKPKVERNFKTAEGYLRDRKLTLQETVSLSKLFSENLVLLEKVEPTNYFAKQRWNELCEKQNSLTSRAISASFEDQIATILASKP